MIDFKQWTQVNEWIRTRSPFVLKVTAVAVDFDTWNYRASVWANNQILEDAGLWKTPEIAILHAEEAARQLADKLCP